MLPDDPVLVDLLERITKLERESVKLRQGVATAAAEASIGAGTPVPVNPVRDLVADERVHLICQGKQLPVAVPHEL